MKATACPSNLKCPGSDFPLGESRAGQMVALLMKLSQPHLAITHALPLLVSTTVRLTNHLETIPFYWGERHSLTDIYLLLYITCK